MQTVEGGYRPLQKPFTHKPVLIAAVTSPGGIVEQTEQTFKNLTAILKEAGVGLNSIVKATRGCCLSHQD